MEYTNKSFSVGQTTNKCERCQNNKTDICDKCNFLYDKFIEYKPRTGIEFAGGSIYNESNN